MSSKLTKIDFLAIFRILYFEFLLSTAQLLNYYQQKDLNNPVVQSLVVHHGAFNHRRRFSKGAITLTNKIIRDDPHGKSYIETQAFIRQSAKHCRSA